MEESELGMETFKSMLETHNLPLPVYDYDNPYLSLTFSRSFEAVRNVTRLEALKELSDEELYGYEWVKSKGEVSTKEYAKYFECSQRTASRHLANMYNLGILITNGENIKSPKLKYLPK